MHTRFCAREFIKRHLIGSRPTLVSPPPPFFHPFALPPRVPRTKVEYIRDRIRVCTMSRAMSMSLYFSSPSFVRPLFSPHAADFLLLVARADLYLCPPLVFVFQPLLSFLRPSKQRRRVQRLLLLFSSRLSNAVTDAVLVCKLHCECKKEKG